MPGKNLEFAKMAQRAQPLKPLRIAACMKHCRNINTMAAFCYAIHNTKWEMFK